MTLERIDLVMSGYNNEAHGPVSVIEFIDQLAPLLGIKSEYIVILQPDGTVLLKDDEGVIFERKGLVDLNIALKSGWQPRGIGPDEFLKRTKDNQILFDEYSAYSEKSSLPLEEIMADLLSEAAQNEYISNLNSLVEALRNEDSADRILQGVDQLIHAISSIDQNPTYFIPPNEEKSALKHNDFHTDLINLFRNLNQDRHTLFSPEVNAEIVNRYLARENQLTGTEWNYSNARFGGSVETNWRLFLGLSREEQEKIRQGSWGKAIDYMHQIKEAGNICVDDLIHMHRIISKGFLPSTETGLRTRGTHFGEYEGVDAANVPQAMNNLLDKSEALLNKHLPDALFFIESARLYDEFIGIHPFTDKNGSVGVLFAQVLSHLYGAPLPNRIASLHPDRLRHALGDNEPAYRLAQVLVGIRSKTGEGYQSVPNATDASPMIIRMLKGSSAISKRDKQNNTDLI